jgi:NAD(P)-dependent dehydrogenase (short-subunit alcohol dehydrogenase family)
VPFDKETVMQSDLSGCVSIVTGAAQGIGRAIAERLARCGARVVYADINADLVHKSAASAPQGTDHMAIKLDVADTADVGQVIEQIVARYGRIDHLVNNAGVNTMDHRVTIDLFPRQEWDRIVAVDMTGVYEMSRAVAAVMKRQKSGRIVNIASVAGLVPLRLQCAFTAAKAGVINLTKAMALELGPDGILVNCIAPGSVQTPGTKELFEKKYDVGMQAMLNHVALGRQATVDEIAVGVQFLLDPENTYTTGHVLTIDGGWTAGYARDF